MFMGACCGLTRGLNEAAENHIDAVSLKKRCISLKKFSTGKHFTTFTYVGIVLSLYSKIGGPDVTRCAQRAQVAVTLTNFKEKGQRLYSSLIICLLS